MTSPSVQETSPAPLPVDRDPFLDDDSVPTPAALALEPSRRRRILD